MDDPLVVAGHCLILPQPPGQGMTTRDVNGNSPVVLLGQALQVLPFAVEDAPRAEGEVVQDLHPAEEAEAQEEARDAAKRHCAQEFTSLSTTGVVKQGPK